jgi:Carbohydrate esterase, sialic acid-specific acetylesterase
MKNRICMFLIVTLLTAQIAWAETPAAPPLSPASSPAAKKDKPIKVFLLVGDENILEQGVISGAKPGTLETVVAQNPKYAFLKSKDGKWVTRDDVVVYDLHPLLNNTVSIGHYLQVGDVPYGGKPARERMGVELMFGTVMGEHFKEPVLLVRYANIQSPSASLGRNFLPPSSGGAGKITGGWDVIHFNFGVWDAQFRDKSNKFYLGEGRHPTSYEDWEANLRKLVASLKKTGATLIWASVTPVWAGSPGRENADVKKYNAIAEKIMKENDVIIDDLYSESIRQGFPKSDDVHSVGNLAPKVIEGLTKALAERKEKSLPLPRLLLIGDSITGSYRNGVMNAFDGKVEFYMQPGNAGFTWNGLREIDNWLDLNRYIKSGDDYINLVQGLRRALKNPALVYPDYAGQGMELAGLVWFHGLGDGTSPAMAADYQENLNNLVKDLRKDLDAPQMPVLVAALSPSPKGLRYVKPACLKKIFDAQMAVGDPKQFPEFAGNVISLDTSSYVNPPELCPEALPSPTTFGGSAESYLKLGEQMANALLQLMEGKRKQP